MRENIKTIRFTMCFSVLFALFTYIITLNMEIGFFRPNWAWLSNNFALTVCGGAFASFLVVMLCEIQKYWSNKKSCEDYLFYQTLYLYDALYAMSKNIEEYIENKNEAVHDDILETRKQMVYAQIAAIQSVDYITFNKKHTLEMSHQHFCADELVKIRSVLGDSSFFKMAVITTRINNLERTCSQGAVTTSDILITQTLSVLDEKFKATVSAVSNYLGAIDHSCDDRYDAKGKMEIVHKGYISIIHRKGLDEFLKNSRGD